MPDRDGGNAGAAFLGPNEPAPELDAHDEGQAAERGHGHKNYLLARNQVPQAMGGRGGAPLPAPNLTQIGHPTRQRRSRSARRGNSPWPPGCRHVGTHEVAELAAIKRTEPDDGKLQAAAVRAGFHRRSAQGLLSAGAAARTSPKSCNLWQQTRCRIFLHRPRIAMLNCTLITILINQLLSMA